MLETSGKDLASGFDSIGGTVPNKIAVGRG